MKGNILKSEYQLTINDKKASLHILSSNILKEEEEYKSIKKDDIVAVSGRSSGFESLKAVIVGFIILVIGIQLISTFGDLNIINFTTILIGILVIIYGIQQSFDIELIYQSMSETLPVAIGGKLEFEGSGELPIGLSELAETMFPKGQSEVMRVVTKDGFLGLFSFNKTLTVTDSVLTIEAEKSTITPSTYKIVPLKNIISINIAPTSFRSLFIGIIGILFVIGGVLAVLTGSITGVIIIILGGILGFYGFARIMKTTFTYSITGNKIRSFVLDGEIVEASHDIEQMGEVIMGAVVDIQPQQEEVPAK